MKFYEIIQKLEFDDVWPQLEKIYVEMEEDFLSTKKGAKKRYKYTKMGYSKAFKELKTLTPDTSDITIRVHHVIDDIIPEEIDEYDTVDGLKEGESMSYGLMIFPWRQWLGSEVLSETIDMYSESFITAHCLFEMTWMGFTSSDVDRKTKEMLDYDYEFIKTKKIEEL